MNLISLGFILIIIGIAIIVIGTLISILRGGGEVKSGGVILIGPFPIVWGTDSKWVLITIIIAIIILIVLTFILPYMVIKI